LGSACSCAWALWWLAAVYFGLAAGYVAARYHVRSRPFSHPSAVALAYRECHLPDYFSALGMASRSIGFRAQESVLAPTHDPLGAQHCSGQMPRIVQTFHSHEDNHSPRLRCTRRFLCHWPLEMTCLVSKNDRSRHFHSRWALEMTRAGSSVLLSGIAASLATAQCQVRFAYLANVYASRAA
jgi:hypothetical protein